jgi:hypothetical protein
MAKLIDLTNFDPDSNFGWSDYVDLSNKITTITQHTLSQDLETHASVYAYYAGVMNKLKKSLDLAESTLEKLNADIRLRYHRESKSKLTEKMLEAHVVSNDDYNKLKQDIIDLEYKYNLFKSLCHSLEHRKDMLVQLSSNKRNETKLYS